MTNAKRVSATKLSSLGIARLRALAAQGPLVSHPDYADVDKQLIAAGLAEPYDDESLDSTLAGANVVNSLDGNHGPTFARAARSAFVDTDCGGAPHCKTHQGGKYDVFGQRQCRN